MLAEPRVHEMLKSALSMQGDDGMHGCIAESGQACDAINVKRYVALTCPCHVESLMYRGPIRLQPLISCCRNLPHCCLPLILRPPA